MNEKGKRDAEDDKKALENDDAYVALPSAGNLEDESADKRDIRRLPIPNTLAKRAFRKLQLNPETSNDK